MKKKAYSGRIIDLYVHDVVIEGRKVRREIVHHPGAAAILPIDEDGQVVLVRQNRYPHGYVLEVPAGTMEPKETPMQCARRELREETGYAAKKLSKLVSYHPTIGSSTEIIHCYVASGLKKAGGSKLDSDEFITVKRLSFKRLLSMVLSNKITDSKTICSVLTYAAKSGML